MRIYGFIYIGCCNLTFICFIRLLVSFIEIVYQIMKIVVDELKFERSVLIGDAMLQLKISY